MQLADIFDSKSEFCGSESGSLTVVEKQLIELAEIIEVVHLVKVIADTLQNREKCLRKIN
jgi:hypothetical protein